MHSYDVALSFSGSDRAYVIQVANYLRALKVDVFYDNFEHSTLWGKNLYQHLSEVYSQARFCVIFVSEQYARGLWTGQELAWAQERAFSENREYILPVRFDNTKIPGVPDTVAYIDATEYDPAGLARLITEKLRTVISLSPHDSINLRFFTPPSNVDTWGVLQRMVLFRTQRNRDWLDSAQGLTQILLDMRLPNGSWIHESETLFNAVYATAGAVTFLAQSGIPVDSPLLASSISFLQAHANPAIDARAAFAALIPLGKVSEAKTIAFTDILAQHQISDPKSPLHGSFLFNQGSDVPCRTNDPWLTNRLHRDGAAFHACHVADMLLHIPAKHAGAQSNARPVLGGIRQYLARVMEESGGYLSDIMGQRTPLTLFGYSLLPNLSIPLPENWREITDDIVTQLPERDLLTRAFGVMNLKLMADTLPGIAERAHYQKYIDEQVPVLLDLATCGTVEAPRDVAVLGRAALYGAKFGLTLREAPL